MKTVGIIGFNGFGEFLASKLDGLVELRISSRSPNTVPVQWRSSFEDVAASDYLIMSVPLAVYPAILNRLRGVIGAKTVFVDVCSVKVEPIKLVKEAFPDHQLVATHPLFGPQSAADSLSGHTFVICPEASDVEHAKKIAALATSLGLKVVYKSADAHDKDMAVVHGLTFFVARALVNCGIHDVELQTPSFQKLLSLAELERSHTKELFETIQKGNQYTADMRNEFIKQAEILKAEIEGVQDPV